MLRVTALKRRAGSRRYEVVIEAREWVYDRALERMKKGDKKEDTLTAAQTIAEDDNIGIDFTPMGIIPAPAEGDRLALSEWSFAAGDVAADRLRGLGEAMELLTNKFGLGMYLIRKGALFAGPERHLIGDLHDLTSDQLGPIPGCSKSNRAARNRPIGTSCSTPRIQPGKSPSGTCSNLTMRGRPDIRPGDFVEFIRPPEETDDAGSPTSFLVDVIAEVKPGTKTKMYVRGATHRLARDRGFVTILRGVSVPGADNDTAWFRPSPPKGPMVTSAEVSDDSPEGALTGTFRELLDKSGGHRIDVAQIRAAHVQDSKLPNQTEELWRGLVAGEGNYGAAHLAFDGKGMSRFVSAPYASPFAWGGFGLILPRYPGMRVLVAHRLGDPDDIVDVGALWERGQAPASKPGDYWLILPAGIDEDDRAQVADDQKPKEPGGKATNDLIDADGNRVIEVGNLTVRVGADRLRPAGTRPAVEAAPVHIEHTGSGSRIVIDQDGNISIQAKKALTITAEEDITLDSKKKVVVKVGEIMDVKAR